jgi:hypothetical protein
VAVRSRFKRIRSGAPPNLRNLWDMRGWAPRVSWGRSSIYLMLSRQSAFPGLAQVACEACGHPRGIHCNPEGACSVFCGCKRWTAPIWWILLNDDDSDRAGSAAVKPLV